MRNDHVFYGRVGGAHPTAEDVELAVRRARRMRAEAVHTYLKRAVRWLRWPFRADRIKVTVPARAATC